jgi:hypothetical protein
MVKLCVASSIMANMIRASLIGAPWSSSTVIET